MKLMVIIMTPESKPTKVDIDLESATVDVTEAWKPVQVVDGEHIAVLTGMEGRTGMQFGDVLVWKFKITEGENEGVEIQGLSSRKQSDRSKLTAWASAILGKEINIGDKIKLKDLLNKPCKIITKTVSRQDKLGRTQFQSKVSEVLKLSKPKGK